MDSRFQFLTPEMERQLLAAGNIDSQRQQLNSQLERAQAMRTNNADKRETGLGAALSGLGDIGNSYMSAKKTKEADAGQTTLDTEQLAANKALVDALRATGGASPPLQQTTQPQQGPIPLGPGTGGAGMMPPSAMRGPKSPEEIAAMQDAALFAARLPR